jgi:ribonuclease P protein component
VLYTLGNGPATRTGITVSRKVGNAVVRNRIKRFVREFVRTRTSSLPGSFDLVIIAKPGAGARDHHEINEELESFWTYLARRKSRR